jgi:energy-converting hydrogenase Eha subunit E
MLQPETLQKIINKIPKNDFFIIMGDLNARVGNNRLGNYIGRRGENTINKNGVKLLDFVSYNHLKIMNTFLNIQIVINIHGQQENKNQ